MQPKIQSLDIKKIIEILPHRYPFLLVDAIVDMDLDKGYILGKKNVTINEPFFQGHFPNMPIMPGVLILEALAQTGCVFVHLKVQQNNKIAVLLNVNNAKFRQPVRPGDILFLRCQELHSSSKGGRVKAEAFVKDHEGKDHVVTEAEIGFVFVDKNQI
jgi:3-hydroxyacyl-[acyl-carrier-protein] dehydratase